MKGVGATETTDAVEADLTICAICLEAFAIGQPVANSRNDDCSHTFHIDCISEWLMKHNECPCCRAIVLDKERFESGLDNEEEALAQGLAVFDRLQREETSPRFVVSVRDT